MFGIAFTARREQELHRAPRWHCQFHPARQVVVCARASARDGITQCVCARARVNRLQTDTDTARDRHGQRQEADSPAHGACACTPRNMHAHLRVYGSKHRGEDPLVACQRGKSCITHRLCAYIRMCIHGRIDWYARICACMHGGRHRSEDHQICAAMCLANLSTVRGISASWG